MKTFSVITRRNIKLFFKDKGMFLTSLITPMILLVLYVTFLGDVYRDSFAMHIPEALTISDKVMDGLIGGQLISSILSVSCVTVAFCSNFLMVNDKALGTSKDLLISPVKPSLLALSYYIATLASTLIICFSAAALCLGYIAVIGFYMSVSDVLLLLLDIIILVLFGTAVSSVVNFFLTSQGQISAVGTLVSSCYGFISGAYMPISSFGEGLQKVISFLPGTYGTALLRGHAMQGALAEMEAQGLPAEIANSMRDAVDINAYFFGNKVEVPVMYAIICGATALILAVYVLLNKFKKVK
jgi:multidrug/hemolysin transport system permease protein